MATCQPTAESRKGTHPVRLRSDETDSERHIPKARSMRARQTTVVVSRQFGRAGPAASNVVLHCSLNNVKEKVWWARRSTFRQVVCATRGFKAALFSHAFAKRIADRRGKNDACLAATDCSLHLFAGTCSFRLGALCCVLTRKMTL